MDKNPMGVTNDEFQVAVYALCDGWNMCGERTGCRCVEAQEAAGDLAWAAFTAVHNHRKNA